MIINGIDTDALPAQFEKATSGTLSLDADGLLYVATNKVAKMSTAIRNAKTRIMELAFLTKCGLVRAHLTSRGSTKAGRYNLLGVKPYQGNRTGKEKPPLLEPLREWLAAEGAFLPHEGVEVYLHRDMEADDAMMMDAYTIPDVVVYSPDKDLRIVPCSWYDLETGRTDKISNRYGWLGWDETKGKVTGHGTAFFWAQMLMGDAADNVKGLRCVPTQSTTYRAKRFANPDCHACGGTGRTGIPEKCECLREWYNKDIGPSEAFSLLGVAKTEDGAANIVLDAYRAIDQNPLPEAGMLWLLRAPHDTAEGYIWSLGLSEQNRAFVQDCYNREYRRKHGTAN